MGDLFERGQVFLPELVLASDAMTAAASVCSAAVADAERQGRPGEGSHRRRHRPGRRPRHRQDHRGRLPARQRLRRARPRPRHLGRQVHRQGRGGRRQGHRHERPAHDDHARAEADHRGARQSRSSRASTRPSSAAVRPRRTGPTRSAPTRTPKTPTTASARSTCSWVADLTLRPTELRGRSGPRAVRAVPGGPQPHWMRSRPGTVQPAVRYCRVRVIVRRVTADCDTACV